MRGQNKQIPWCPAGVSIILLCSATPMSSFAKVRIQHDIENLVLPLEGCVLDGFSLLFTLSLGGPLYTGQYDFVLEFPEEYPFKSPRLLCKTPVFHPNIDENGRVCLRVLREGWLPAYNVSSVVVSLFWVFSSPSGEDALNTEAGRLLELDYEEFKRRVMEKQYTAQKRTVEYI